MAVIEEVISLCASISATARRTQTCRPDCRTLARFVGKVSLILQALEDLPGANGGSGEGDGEGEDDGDGSSNAAALQPAPCPSWPELLADTMEALAGCAELVQACAAMGQLEAVLAAEEVHARFCATAADLALAVAGLGAAREAAPEDVGEDMASLQTQLGRLRFACRNTRDGLATGLLRALVLLAAGARGASGARAAASAAEHLEAALAAAGLDRAPPAAWLEHELARLAHAARLARGGGDVIGEFFCKQVILCLLAHASNAWSWVAAIASGEPAAVPLGSNGLTLETAEAESAASAETCEQLTTTSGTSDKENGQAAEVVGADAAACAGSDAGPLPTTSLVQQPGLQDCDAQQLTKEEVGVALQQLLAAWVRCSSGASPLLPAAALHSLTAATASELLQLFGEERSSGSRALRSIVAHDLGSAVAALASPDPVTQLAAVTLIEAAAEEGGEAARAAVVELQAIPVLLRVLQGSGAGSAGSRHPALRGAVATAFRHLARDPGVRKRVVSAGAIPPLVAALQSPSAATQQAAARAISNLVVNSCESKLEAVKFGAVHSLTRMLGPGESAVCRETAAAAVGNLAANCEEAQGLLAEAGAVPLLAGVLGSGTPAARQHAARALRNLAGRDSRNKLQAMQAGAIPLLVELLGHGGDQATRAAAASALSNIACNCEETQRAIAAAGALPVICALLEPSDCGDDRQGEQSAAAYSAGDDGQAPGPCALACREAAAWLLSNLACSTEVRHALAKHEVVAAHTAAAAAKAGAAPPAPSGGVVAGLVELLSIGSEGGRQAAARAIKNLAAGQGNGYKARIAEAGAIPPLVQLLRSPADATRRAASSALWNLAYRANANRRLIAQAGAVPLLVGLLRPGANSAGCRQEAARALSNISCNNDVNQGMEMARAGAVPLLVGLMEKNNPPAAREAAAGAISNLACIKANQAAIIAAGAVPLMLGLLAPDAGPGCQEAAARGLGNIFCDSIPEQLRPEAYRAIPRLVDVAAGGQEGARIAAARALSNLACSDPATQAMVARSGAPAALVALCQSPGEELRGAAATALWDLAYDSEEGRAAVAAAGAVPWLTQLLLFGGASAKEAAAATLAELAAVGPAVQRQIRDAGAVALLRTLARGDNGEVALAATEALRSLEVNASRSSLDSVARGGPASSGEPGPSPAEVGPPPQQYTGAPGDGVLEAAGEMAKNAASALAGLVQDAVGAAVQVVSGGSSAGADRPAAPSAEQQAA